MFLTSFHLIQSEGGLKILKTQQPIQHALRAVAIFLCNMIFFSAIATLPLATATALFFVARHSPHVTAFLFFIATSRKL